MNFSNADFRVGVSRQALYERCDFSNAKLSKVQFQQCAFADCRFAGDLRGVLFDGRALPDSSAPPPMTGVDFVSAKFSEVEFRGCMLEGVRLPDDPAIRVIGHFPAVLTEALNLLDGDETPHARALRAVLTNHQRMVRNPTEDYVFNRRDWQSWGGEDEALFVESVLSKAEAAAASKHRQGRRGFDLFRRRP